MNALDERLTTTQIEYLTSLAGVGVAFKLAQGVLEHYKKLDFSYEILPFVTVGTIADIVPLIGENRYFVTKGLDLIARGKHYGLKRLLDISGVNTDNVMFFAYTNMGFLSAVAALVCVARLNSAQPTAGNSYEMDAIASCFIGGASAYGGTGTVTGAVIGAIFMGVLNNGMSILGIDQNWQRAVKGLVLLAAVIFDVVSKKKKSSK
jgi:predicted ABC-type sugar transport system permease subunit